jgi:SAM-dependent methyltransferase
MTRKEVFAADWLSLREPVDHAARSEHLAGLLVQHLEAFDAINIVDLGAGQGSNLRWLAPRLPIPQRWLLIDHDPGLLELALGRSQKNPPAKELSVDGRTADLADTRFQLLDGFDLVTASALLDLVSTDWLKHLAQACRSRSSAAYFALTVNGFWRIIDAKGNNITEDNDILVRDAFNRHQRRDKGMGAALGPMAAEAMPAIFSAEGYAVEARASDWVLPAGHAWTLKLGPALMTGWREAALEDNPSASSRIEGWFTQRMQQLNKGHLGIEVGHVDFLALPDS